MDAGTKRGLVAVKFQIDAAASRFTVQAFATGLLSSFGHNPTIGIRDFDGEIECEPESFDNARVRLMARTDAMEVLDRNEERRSQETRTGNVR